MLTRTEKSKATDEKAMAFMRQKLRALGISTYDVNYPKKGMHQLGHNHPVYDLVCRRKGKGRFYLDVKGVAEKKTAWPTQERDTPPKHNAVRYLRALERVKRHPLLYAFVCVQAPMTVYFLTQKVQEQIYIDYRKQATASKTKFLVINRAELSRYGAKIDDWGKLFAAADQAYRSL